MIQMTVAMTTEAFKCALAAGEARRDQLLQDKMNHMALAICSGVQIVASAVVFGVASASHS